MATASRPLGVSGAGPPVVGGASVTVLEGDCFCISDDRGDIDPGRPLGLFARDTRLLSTWQLRVDGEIPSALHVQRTAPFSATFLSRPPPHGAEPESRIVITRVRHVGSGMREDVSVHNNSGEPRSCLVELAIDADLADLFEVKEGRAAPHATRLERAGPTGVRIRRGNVGVDVAADTAAHTEGVTEGAVDGVVLRWRPTIAARGRWRLQLQVAAVVDGQLVPVRHAPPEADGPVAPARRLRAWRRQSPAAETADPELAETLRRSVEDLGALRIFDPNHPGRAVVAAGAPWFMALFGRDSLLTAWMALPLHAGLALGTLQSLADYQGRETDPDSEEQPGRIPHEVRFGPSPSMAFGVRNAYYGTADATALFVALAGELRRWRPGNAEVQALLPHVDRALEWIEQSGDVDGDGFVEYERSSEHGLANQGWKDSDDGISFADGSAPRPPIALAEVQAYTYAAYVARAEWARDLGDPAGAARWSRRAADLRRAFDRAYWLPGQRCYAVGLDGDKRPIDSITSNAGHCLWTGIAAPPRAEIVAERLLSADLFSGWGIRTLATTMAAYNPVSYHNGSVWPHDTALCIAGLTRYGLVRHAQRAATGLLDAAAHFGGRLPELFCGFDRGEFAAGPVPYPTSCSPQAWAAAAPLLLLRSLLRFDADVPGGRLWCAPVVPRRYLPLTVRNLRLGPSAITVAVGEHLVDVHRTDGPPLAVRRFPRPLPGLSESPTDDRSEDRSGSKEEPWIT
ncbi:MAG TPA: glycogen debranching N-terminal domain-containing protein [Jatrophihabitans sp.]|nr:glycogen debranching N-terminal domain-containing protein [Jatrophihabitans sp.]